MTLVVGYVAAATSMVTHRLIKRIYVGPQAASMSMDIMFTTAIPSSKY